MKIRFVTPYFPPEVGAAQTRIYELAARLVSMGHEVSVLTTFPNYPSGVVPQEWRKMLFWKGTDGGICVYRVWSYAAANKGFLKRILSHLSFAAFATAFGLFSPKTEAIIIESPPLFDGFVGVIVGCLRRVPYLFTVADLWPESAVQMGALKNRVLIWLSEQIEMLFYRRSAAVLAITRGIENKLVARDINPSKVKLFRNAVDLQFFSPNVDAADVRQTIAGACEFVVLYAGTLGMAHNLEVVLRAAAQFQDERDKQVKFVLAGDGAEKERLQTLARKMHLHNVGFLAPFPKVRMPLLLKAADCIVVSLSDLEIFRGALPTKLLEAMACAKPVVLAVAGEAAEVLAEAQAGYCVSPGNHVEIHDAILKLMREPEVASRMGNSGREYVGEHFDRDRSARQLIDLLNNLISNQKSRRNVKNHRIDTETANHSEQSMARKVSSLSSVGSLRKKSTSQVEGERA